MGAVSVNGEVVTAMGAKVGPTDEVSIGGQNLARRKMQTILMNKPRGYVTTMSDPQRRRTVMELLPANARDLRPVGRLDMDTEGLLLFTNDGDLASRLSHPRWSVEKEYVATVQGLVGERQLKALSSGVMVEGRKSASARVSIVRVDAKRATTILKLVIHEGRKRQVRLMCLAVGHKVLELRRVRLGPLVLRGLAPGQCRLLGMAEVAKLRALVGLD